MTLEIINVTKSIKANTRIIENESNLFFKYFNQLFFGIALIPHIVLSELCISAKIVVAPKTETAKLTIVANVDELLFAAFSMTEFNAFTTLVPNIGSN